MRNTKSNQRWLLVPILILFCCVGMSHQQLSLLRQYASDALKSVVSEISPSTCTVCEIVVRMVQDLLLRGKSVKEVAGFAGSVCGLFGIESPSVCTGIMSRMGGDAIYAIKYSDMQTSHTCNLYFGDACDGGSDPRHDWNVTFPGTKKPANRSTSPPAESSPRLKVLQITDVHYDPYYQEGSNADCNLPMCCRASSGWPAAKAGAAGKWGDYRKCDSPLRLIESAFQHIVHTHKDIDYIIWTGDLPPHDIWNQTKQENLKNIKVFTKLMDKYFKGIPIFPAVGNHESFPVDSFAPPVNAPHERDISYLYDELVTEWSRWLPNSTFDTIRTGAFYSVLIRPKLRIIAVNGNYCNRNNFLLLLNSTDPVGQLEWLINELEAAEAKGEKVHILNHIPPGQPDCLKAWSRNYYDIINRYEATIIAQFHGHTHYDEFEVYYDTEDTERPVGIGYISPSITPWKDCNPAYRIYYVDGDHENTTREIIDFETWKMNLDEANENGFPVWLKAYNARKAYGMPSVLPKDWDKLIQRMASDEILFDAFHRNYYRDTPTRPHCDEKCQKSLLCDLRSGKSHVRKTFCPDL